MKKLKFTLIELMVAMAVFALLMASLMQFFGSAQKLWSLSSSKSEMFENARVALEMISRDLQSAYYSSGTTPFYVSSGARSSASAMGCDTSNPEQRLAFIAYSDNKPCNSSNANKISRVCKIQYYLQNWSATNNNKHTLMVYVIGNLQIRPSTYLGTDFSMRWNFGSAISEVMAFGGSVSSLYTTTQSDVSAGSAADSENCYYACEIIPYVVDFRVDCYKQDNFNTPDTANSPTTSMPDSNPMCSPEFPYAVQITLSLLSRNDYNKWSAMSAGAAKDAYLTQHMRTFTKRVVIGNRGQYDS